MQNKLTILIPAYNEGQQLIETVVFFTKNFPELPLIIVDDGSTDGSIKKISHASKIFVHRNQTNLGKSAAIEQGLQFVSTPWVCLFDADLKQLRASEIALGFQKIYDTPHDMIVFVQKNESLLWKWLHYDMLLSGERCIKTATLQQFFRDRQPTEYAFELELYEWFREHAKTIETTTMYSQNKFKLSKWQAKIALKKSWGFYRYLLFERK